jgi:hypothetical protein
MKRPEPIKDEDKEIDPWAIPEVPEPLTAAEIKMEKTMNSIEDLYQNVFIYDKRCLSLSVMYYVMA